MRLLVLGRGIASHCFLEALFSHSKLLKKVDNIQWIGTDPDKGRYPSCSTNSTAIIARHGIERGVSPLGDLLLDGFEQTREFINNEKPQGIEALNRFHLGDLSKLKERFGEAAVGDFSKGGISFKNCVHENSWHVNPSVLFGWWSKRFLAQGLSPQEDFICQIEKNQAIGLKKTYDFDFCVNATGALGLSTGLTDKGSITPGNYIEVLNPIFEEAKIDSSFVITQGPYNLIYSKLNNWLLYGGTNERDGVLAPRVKNLENSLDQLLLDHPELKFSGKKGIRVGVRHKAPKRLPQIQQRDNVYDVIGLYKNGYTVAHALGSALVKRLDNL